MALWRVEEAADYLGIRPKTLYEWVRLDRVPYRKIGFNVRFDPGELEEWVTRQSRGSGTVAKSVEPDAAVDTAVSAQSEHNAALLELAVEASGAIRALERDLGANLSYPQRRRLTDLAERLDQVLAEVDAGSGGES